MGLAVTWGYRPVLGLYEWELGGSGFEGTQDISDLCAKGRQVAVGEALRRVQDIIFKAAT